MVLQLGFVLIESLVGAASPRLGSRALGVKAAIAFGKAWGRRQNDALKALIEAWEREQRSRIVFQLELQPFTGVSSMPWTANDAERHTHKAITWELKELWAKVANESLERNADEGRAIREANAVVARRSEASE